MAEPFSCLALFGLLCLIQLVCSLEPMLFTKQECLSRGFTPSLLCTSCDSLPNSALDQLVEDCKGCCQQDHNDQVSLYQRGADPTLKFLNEKNQVQDTLSIEKWNTDTVEEFLQERLL